jgi:Ser/Thr protein kinase RdoA (MazF antagonist)
VPQLVPAHGGDLLCQDEEGYFWRAFEYVEDTTVFEVCPGARQAAQAGEAFGLFLRRLSTLPAPALHEPIPRFQDSRYRWEQFEAARREAPERRLAAAAEELGFALSHAQLTEVIPQALADARIPLRATHGDPKINNLLFSLDGGAVVSVVDLDTCMPGTSLYDFGDMVRTAAATAPEDEPDASKMKMDREFFAALAQGYARGAGGILTEAETELFFEAPLISAYVQGLRFLSDYLSGDRYYKIDFTEHNLQRCRAQFALTQSMQESSEFMQGTIKRCME